MKAAYYENYGTTENIKIKEVKKPIPKDKEVLVKVHAASINSWDWDMLRGRPYIVRLWGLTKPKYKIPGADMAGVVEEVGNKVTQFKPGDEVYGDLSESGWGAIAEYVCADEKSIGIKSPKMTFEQAASLPQNGVMALQSIYDRNELKPGQKILINGAGGAVGPILVQIAKNFGAEVTVVDKSEKFDLLKSLGADYAIDYRETNYTATGDKFDLIVDVIANKSIWEYKRCLKPGGRFYMIGGTGKSIIQALFIGPLISLFSRKNVGILGQKTNKYLDLMNQLFEENKFKPVIDKVFSLNETPQAMQKLGDGNSQGKIVIKICD